MERTNYRYLWIGLGILALLALFALPIMGGGFSGYGYGPRPFGFVGGPGAWFFGIGFLFRILIWGAILFFIVNVFRRRRWYRRYEDDYREPTELPSDEILRRRYAAGEITREQYEEMQQVLQPRA